MFHHSNNLILPQYLKQTGPLSSPLSPNKALSSRPLHALLTFLLEKQSYVHATRAH